MKTLTCSCVVAALAFASALAAGAQWQIDYDKALAAAKAEDRPLFINFTGSDWCGPCIEMHKRVFSQKEFMEYADKHLVLVEVDYPKIKALSDEVKQQNERLKSEFNINKLGFPTIALVDSSGKLLGTSTGYDDEKPADIIARIEKWMKH
jgi:protein disulfide-isomerase